MVNKALYFLFTSTDCLLLNPAMMQHGDRPITAHARWPATTHARAPITHVYYTYFCLFWRTKLYSLAHPSKISKNSLRNLIKSASSPPAPRCETAAEELAASCSRKLAEMHDFRRMNRCRIILVISDFHMTHIASKLTPRDTRDQ